MIYTLLLTLLFLPSASWAKNGDCAEGQNSVCIDTLLGQLNIKSGAPENDGVSSITLNGKYIFRVKSDEMMTSNGQDELDDSIKIKNVYLTRKTVIKFWEESPCYCDKFFVLDLSDNEPVISNVIYNPPASYLDWVSWGVEKTVLSLNGVKYLYKNGSLSQLENNK